MNQVEDTLSKTVDWLQKLDGAPAIALVLFTCIMLGTILRFVRKFPNDGIPVAVVLWGGLFYPLIASDNNDITLRVWLVRNVLIGLIAGFVAWLVHKAIISRLEKRFLGDTEFIDKLSGSADSVAERMKADAEAREKLIPTETPKTP